MIRTKRLLAADASGRSHDERDRGRESIPVGALLLEPPAARRSQAVKSGAPVVLRDTPIGGDPPLTFQSLERRVERALVDLKHVVRQQLDPLRDRPPVELLGGDGAHDQEVERALDEVGWFGHDCPWLSTRDSIRRLVDKQGEGRRRPYPGVGGGRTPNVGWKC